MAALFCRNDYHFPTIADRNRHRIILSVRSNESEAWKATKDGLGIACSGEMEVRLWASYRGQTLARTVHGMMQYARAIRLLATMHLEMEYVAIEEGRPPEEQRR